MFLSILSNSAFIYFKTTQSHFLPVRVISEEKFTEKFSVHINRSPIKECNMRCSSKGSEDHECPHLWLSPEVY
jgi:hypothetical protein